jgi:phenylpropionate dioxygenase-like ring-hydroxylating dioxygenase large terminal subunit
MAKLITSDHWVDVRQGLVEREIFSDRAVYELELQKIFGRAWNFMCHESQITKPGDYFMNAIGEEQVIVVRGRDEAINVLLNSCPHRGNSVCRAEQGNTRSFFCSYHGWNFALDGRLIAVPGSDKYYGDQLDFDEWGLTRVPRVESYGGFVFACLDNDAPSLHDFLGWVGRLGIDQIAGKGEMVIVDGIQKNRIHCNWKLAVDNLFDWYHPKVSHQSAIQAGVLTEEALFPMDQMVLLGEYGHAIGGPGLSPARLAESEEKHRQLVAEGGTSRRHWRSNPASREALGSAGVRSRGHPNIFPNVWITQDGSQLCLRLPKGPVETEIWWFTLVEKSMTEDERRRVIQAATHFFGPAGLLEQDDGENWSHSTRGSIGRVARRKPLNYSMRSGLDEVTVGPDGQKSIETVVNEHAQLWTYRCWEEWMTAESWPDLIAHHSPEPTDAI